MDLPAQPESQAVAARAATGALLWVFVLLIPALHLGLPAKMSALHLLALCLPVLVLASAVWKRSAVGLLLAYPISLLPLLMRFPELTGPRIYGLGAFAATAVTTLAFVFSVTAAGAATGPTRAMDTAIKFCTAPGHRDPRDARRLSVLTAALATALFVPLLALHFHRPVRESIGAAYAGYEGRATAFFGLLLFVSWLLFGLRGMIRRVGAAMLDDRDLIAESYRFEAAATDPGRVRVTLLWAAGVAVVSGVCLLLVIWKGA